MPIQQTNGVATHYQRAGQGPEVILIHGLATNLAFWYFAILPALSRDFTVTSYDLRGHGRSEMTPSGYSSEVMAGDLESLMDHLAIESAHLVAHSFGGAIALQMAVRNPERVLSLVLADPTIPALRPQLGWPPESIWAQELALISVKLPEDPLDSGLDLFQDLALAQARPVNNEMSPGFGVPFQSAKGGRETAELWCTLLATTCARSELTGCAGLTRETISTVRHPTLTMIGGCSRWLTIRDSLKELLPQSREVIVPGVGHFHPFTRPRFFASTVSEFLMEPAKTMPGGGN